MKEMLKKSAVIAVVCLAVLCVSGYGEPTVEQVKERTNLLHKATRKNNIEQARLCIKLGADVNAKVGYNGWTALLNAACRGYREMVELLIEAGADVNATNDDDLTALMYAAKIEDKDMAELLIKAGADSATTLKWAIKGDNYFNRSKVLIEAGADVNAKDVEGISVLTYAILYGRDDIAELLRAAGAKE